MIDTIAIRIHDLDLHKQLVKFLWKSGIGGSEKRIKLLDDDLNIEREMKFKEYTVDHATGRTYAKSFRFKVKSYNHEISYCIDKDRDFMHFEFSLPKYFYGDNVHQLVHHNGDEHYQRFRNKPWYDLSQEHWMIFKGALLNFFKAEFGDIQIHFNLTEVVCIDFCFNYVFVSENQLKSYLAFIRQVKRKYAKEENAHSAYGPSSIYYPSKICTFKIYHKGPEVKVHMGGLRKKTYKGQILELASRTLRYEASFRPMAFREKYLSRLPEDKACLLAYRRFLKEGRFTYKGKRYGIGSPGKDVILKRGKALDKRMSFWLSSEGIDLKSGNLVFDYGLFKELLASFHVQTKQFMLGNATGLNVTATHVEYYDSEETKQRVPLKGVSGTKVKMIEALLCDRSWFEIERQGIMSKRQLMRYKSLFTRIGYADVNTNVRTDLLNVDMTYKAYFDALKMVKNTAPLPFR